MSSQSLTYLLASISDEAIGAASRMFEHRFGHGIHEIRVLRLIGDNPGITFTRLAERTRFERSATSRMLSRLISAGLIKRRNSREDARQFALFITAKGAALRSNADPLTAELEDLMLAPLRAAEKTRFLASLDAIMTWVAEGFRAEVVARFPEAAEQAAPASRSIRRSRKD